MFCYQSTSLHLTCQNSLKHKAWIKIQPPGNIIGSEGEEYFIAPLRWLVSLALCICIVISFGWPFLSSLVRWYMGICGVLLLGLFWSFSLWFRQVWKQVRLVPPFLAKLKDHPKKEVYTITARFLDVYSDMLVASYGTWGDHPAKMDGVPSFVHFQKVKNIRSMFFHSPYTTEMKLREISFKDWLVKLVYCRVQLTGYYWLKWGTMEINLG